MLRFCVLHQHLPPTNCPGTPKSSVRTSLGLAEEIPSPMAPSNNTYGLTPTPFLLLLMCSVSHWIHVLCQLFLLWIASHFIFLCPIFQSHQFAVSEVSESSNITAFRDKQQQLLYKVMSGMAQNYEGSRWVPPMISSIVIQHNSLHGNLALKSALHAAIFQVSSALSTLKFHINLRAQT